MADRGDLIGCTVMFEMAEKGKVPITFTLNGRRITQTSISIEFNQGDLLLLPFVSMVHEGVAVTAKVIITHFNNMRTINFTTQLTVAFLLPPISMHASETKR